MLRLKYFKMENLSIWCCISWIKISLTVNRMKVLQFVRFVWHHETLLASPDEERYGSALSSTHRLEMLLRQWRERAHYFYTPELIHTHINSSHPQWSTVDCINSNVCFVYVLLNQFSDPLRFSHRWKWMDRRIWNDEENRSAFDWNSQNSSSYPILALQWFRNGNGNGN